MMISSSANGDTYFKRIDISGFTDQVMGTNGMAFGDFNKDGLIDIVVCQSDLISYRYQPDRGPDRLRLFLNKGGFHFVEHIIRLENQEKPLSEDCPKEVKRGNNFMLSSRRKSPLLCQTSRGMGNLVRDSPKV